MSFAGTNQKDGNYLNECISAVFLRYLCNKYATRFVSFSLRAFYVMSSRTWSICFNKAMVGLIKDFIIAVVSVVWIAITAIALLVEHILGE